MSITVNAGELKAAVTWVSKAMPRRGGRMMICVAPGGVYIASSYEAEVVAPILADTDSDTETWTVVIELDDIRGIVQKAPKKASITISHSASENLVAVSYGVTRFAIPAGDCDWTVDAPQDSEYCCMLDLAAMCKIAGGRSMDNGPGRWSVLTAIHIDEVDAQLAATAADGFRLATITVPAVPVSRLTEVVGVNGVNIPDSIIRILPTSGVATLYVGQPMHPHNYKMLTMVLPGNRLARVHVDANAYPDYRRVMPQGWDARITLPVVTLAAAVAQLKPIAELGSGIVRLVYDDGVLRASARVENKEDKNAVPAVTTLAAQRDGAERFQIALNHRYITEALATIESETVAIEMTTPTAPVVFRGGDVDPLWVVMPMFVQW